MSNGLLGRLLALTVLWGPGPLCLPLNGASLSHKKRSHPRSHKKSLVPKTGKSELEGPENLSSFFEGLRALEPGHPSPDVLRVLQFGDSHTAADFWTGCLRQHFQARFGDAGPGLFLPARPWRGYRHEGIKQTFNPDWPSWSLRDRECDGLVGLTGGSITLTPGEAYWLEAPFRGFSVQTLGPAEDRPGINWARPLEAYTPTVPALPPSPIGASDSPETPAPVPSPSTATLPPLALSDVSQILPNGLVVRTLTQPAQQIEGAIELSVTVPVTTRLLGVELRSGHPGVTYEELGLNGAELFDLEKWNPDLRKALLAQARTGLLVLAYGTNDMGRSGLDLEDYRARAAALFRQLAQESKSCILVVGPMDRGARRRKKLAALRAGARMVIEALREAARDAKCAFWDARAAMGGPGAMASWRKRGWAQKDQVHLTGPGYVRLGELEFESIMAAYGRFKKESK